MSRDYNPQSTDAMFAKILERLDQQDASASTNRAEVQTKLDTVIAEGRGVGARVTALENDKWYQRGMVASLGVFTATALEWAKQKWGK